MLLHYRRPLDEARISVSFFSCSEKSGPADHGPMSVFFFFHSAIFDTEHSHVWCSVCMYVTQQVRKWTIRNYMSLGWISVVLRARNMRRSDLSFSTLNTCHLSFSFQITELNSAQLAVKSPAFSISRSGFMTFKYLHPLLSVHLFNRYWQ